MNPRSIPTVTGPVDARIEAPPSKSVTHRALLAAALSEGVSRISNPLDADDTRVTADGLRALGFEVEQDAGVWRVQGAGGRVPGGGAIELRESGTSFRFLLALAALGERATRLDGAPRLRERPCAELVAALSACGARVECPRAAGHLPMEAGGRAAAGGAVSVPGARSSQFVSALLFAGCAVDRGLQVRVAPPLVSRPYVDLTVEVLSSFGIAVQRPDRHTWRVPRQVGEARSYVVEGDHSSASYFLAAAAIRGGRVRVDGLRSASRQPDARLQALLEQLGCNVERAGQAVTVRGSGSWNGFEIDLGDAPDLAPTVAVLALFAEGRSRITGVAHLHLKESDRLALLARNLCALGRRAQAGSDSLTVDGDRAALRGARIVTASDHRMAMAFAVAGLRLEGVVIDDPACVAKSNPAFWSQFETLACSP